MKEDAGERSNASLIELKICINLTLYIYMYQMPAFCLKTFFVRYIDIGISRKLNLNLNENDEFNKNGPETY